MPRMVKCAKLSRELPAIPYKPFNNELGQRIYDSISMEAWKGWLEFSKMIVNEYRLDLTSAAGAEAAARAGREVLLRRGRAAAARLRRAARRSRRPASTKAAVRGPGDVVFVSCYEPGHQPQGVASAVAFLRRAGFQPTCARPGRRAARRRRARAPGGGAARRDLGPDAHGAGARAAASPRTCGGANPRAHLCFFGMYATLNRALLAGDADSVLGPDCELQLVALAESLGGGAGRVGRPAPARPPALTGAGSRRAAGARKVRAPRDRRRRAHRRPRRGDARLQAPVPALPDPARLRGPLLRRAGRHRAGGRARADRRGRAAHRLRRSRFPQRSAARAADRAGAARRAPDRHVQLHRQGRAHRRAARADPRAGGGGRAVRGQRRRIAVRPRARGAGEGPQRGRRATRPRDRARRRPVAAADVRGVHAVDDAGRLSRACVASSAPTRWRTRSTPCSSRCGCSCHRDRRCCRRPTSRRFWDRSTRRRSATDGRTPIRAWTASRPRSRRSSRRRRSDGAPPATTFGRIHRLAATVAGVPDEAPPAHGSGGSASAEPAARAAAPDRVVVLLRAADPPPARRVLAAPGRRRGCAAISVLGLRNVAVEDDRDAS